MAWGSAPGDAATFQDLVVVMISTATQRFCCRSTRFDLRTGRLPTGYGAPEAARMTLKGRRWAPAGKHHAEIHMPQMLASSTRSRHMRLCKDQLVKKNIDLLDMRGFGEDVVHARYIAENIPAATAHMSLPAS